MEETEMRRNEIKETISKEVYDAYNYERDTMEAVIPLTNDTCAVIEKEFGGAPVCHIFFDEDDTTERNLPLVCELIEEEAMETVTDIVEQANFKGYGEDEMYDKYLRNLYR